MSIIRIKKAREKPYVILDTTALNDARLSFRAKGIHTYLMARPDDWQVHIEQLEKESPREARDALRVAMQELETCGYIKRVRVRGDRGRMTGWDTTVYETPSLAMLYAEDERLGSESIGLTEEPPITDSPKSANPLSEKSPKLDLPKSANPLSVEATSILDSSNPPKTDSPKSANPQLLSIYKETKETKEKDTTKIPSPANAAEVASGDSPAGKFIAWWNEHIVPLGGRAFLIDDADAKLIAKANKALKDKSGAKFWERVKQGFETSAWLRGDVAPLQGKKRFKATLPWLLSNHHQKGIANYTLVASGEWTDDTTLAQRVTKFVE